MPLSIRFTYGFSAKRLFQLRAVRSAAAAHFVLVFALTGCATSVPREIASPVPGDPGIARALEHPLDVAGKPVRWGGTIVDIENRAEHTLVTVLARDLGGSGTPLIRDPSRGRFIARFPGFLDPEIYAKARKITVYGVLSNPVRGKIGEYDYAYPVVQVQLSELWPVEEPRPPACGRCWPSCGVWYDPWWYGRGPCGWPGCW